MKIKANYSMVLMIVAIVFIMFCSYIVSRKKGQLMEASRLPFHNVQLEDVKDGTYRGKTDTSFLHLELDVTVENHKLIRIDVLENDGIDGEIAKPILDKMILENKVVVPAIKGAERGSIQYISCVDSALYNGK